MYENRVITSLRGPAPLQPPGPGFEWYLPEDFYFDDQPGFPIDAAAGLVARCVARWSDRYEVFLGDRDRHVSGPFPQELVAREAIIDRIFDLYRSLPQHPKHTVPMNLYEGDIRRLNQHDGLPGMLALRADEFPRLQEALREHGMPGDLYYPSDLMRSIREPIEMVGETVHWTNHYSPLRWLRKEQASRES